jgi:hypothetical protein
MPKIGVHGTAKVAWHILENSVALVDVRIQSSSKYPYFNYCTWSKISVQEKYAYFVHFRKVTKAIQSE